MKRFSQKKENFVCAICKVEVFGNGYTDHCPNCLYSRHVDINPGDRQAKCRGIMRPVGVEIKSGKTKILYKCEKCGYKFKVKAAKNDNQGKILELSVA